MVETVIRKRIEILVDTPLVPRMVEMLRDAGIEGWSILHVDGGGGRDGEWRQDEITGAAAKTFILTIASEARAAALTESLAPLLDTYRLMLTIADVAVVRVDRF